MLVGYARVSTKDQSLDVQRAKLGEAGCEKVFEEKVSGAKRNREQLNALIGYIREGDTLVVYKLDRLARSTKDLLDIVDRLKEKGAGIRSLGEPWLDTTSAAGKMIMTVLAGIAEFERELIRERVADGVRRARNNGTKFGPKFKLTPEQRNAAKRMRENGDSASQVARVFKVSVQTILRATSSK